MNRGFFLTSGLSLTAGTALVACGGAGTFAGTPDGMRRPRFTNPGQGGGDGPGSTPTPNPVDPDSGLKVIGGTSTSWGNDYGGGGWGPGTSMNYTGVGGLATNRNLGKDMGWSASDAASAISRCAGQIGDAAAVIGGFVSSAWSQYGPALQAAIGVASWGSLSLLEALGVVLASLSAPEIAAICAALAISALLLWALYVCLAGV